MDRRFVTFLALVFLIWVSFFIGRQILLPNKPKPLAKNDPKKVEQPGEKSGETEPDKKEPGKGSDPPQIGPDDKPAEDPENKTPTADPEKTPVVARKRVVLGSLDPASPYGLLVTLDSLGAAVERVELNDPRYKSIDSQNGYQGGYLGDLGFAFAGDIAEETQIQIVPAGTPAALAKPADEKQPVGLQPGDVIRDVNGTSILSGQQLDTWLGTKTKPGDTVNITVDRRVDDKTLPFVYQATLIRPPLEMIRPETRTVGKEGRVTDPLSFLLALEKVHGETIPTNADEIASLPSLRRTNWEISEQTQDSVTFSRTLTDSDMQKIKQKGTLKITKRYSLAKTGDSTTLKERFHLNLEVGIENVGEVPVAVAYRLDGPNGIPLEGWWYSTKMHREMFRGAGARDVLYQLGNQPHKLIGAPLIYDNAKKALKAKPAKSTDTDVVEQAGAEPLTIAGVNPQFFAAMVIPKGSEEKDPSEHPIKFARVAAIPMHNVNQLSKTRIRMTNTSVRLVTLRESLDKGASLKHQYQVFLGPKDPEVLRAYGLEPVIEYGWQYAAIPAKWLANLLHWLYGLTGNYGVAIILLTVIVRTCMLPFSIRQAKAAKVMQELTAKLKPEIDVLKEKYKDDPLKQHQATQELMKKHGMPNPFAGCLLVFFQLPVFVGLYRALSVDINLRDASLVPGWDWCSNLAGPDKLFYWGNSVPAFIGDPADGYLGPYFNVLPLITIGLFILQQKLFTPPPTDEQQEMQQKTMMIMSVVMGIFFYKVPAGLCLYFITSSLWSVCERTLLPKTKPVDPNAPAEKPAPKVENGPDRNALRAARKKKR